MVAGSLRSRWQVSKSAHSSIPYRKMYDIGEMQISPGDPDCGCQGHYCMPHHHTWGRRLGWPSPGSWLFPWRHQTTHWSHFHSQTLCCAPQAGASSFSVFLSCSNSRSCFYSLFAEPPESARTNNPVDWKKKWREQEESEAYIVHARTWQSTTSEAKARRQRLWMIVLLMHCCTAGIAITQGSTSARQALVPSQNSTKCQCARD